jgi:hypothetical protein
MIRTCPYFSLVFCLMFFKTFFVWVPGRCFSKKNVDPELKSDGILALAAVVAEEGANSTQGTVAGNKNH